MKPKIDRDKIITSQPIAIKEGINIGPLIVIIVCIILIKILIK